METNALRKVILLVEDDCDDRQIITEAAREAGIEIPILGLEDGESLMSLLFPKDGGAVTVEPILIILDLNLPLDGGRKSLETLKQSETYKRIPVIVFTTAAVKEEIVRTYSAGANSLILKPFSYNALVDIMRLIKAYWLGTVELP